MKNRKKCFFFPPVDLSSVWGTSDVVYVITANRSYGQYYSVWILEMADI
jgi:hypothetical protein